MEAAQFIMIQRSFRCIGLHSHQAKAAKQGILKLNQLHVLMQVVRGNSIVTMEVLENV